MSDTAVDMPELRRVDEPQRRAAERADEFFVGYLPTPQGLSRWLRRVVVALFAVVVTSAAVIAALQNDPGDATWTLDHVESWEGALIARPYPMLRIRGADGMIRTFLLVGEGKHGVSSRVPQYDCAHVRVKGTLLRRDSREMIELSSEDDGFALISGDAPDSTLRLTPELAWDDQELRGEIIDPKCYLGAMKPGEGKVHKACAALCLRGGIPPMFVSTDRTRSKRYYLLVSDDQRPVSGEALERIVALVAEPVRAAGKVAMWGDVLLLKLDPANVIRD